MGHSNGTTQSRRLNSTQACPFCRMAPRSRAVSGVWQDRPHRVVRPRRLGRSQVEGPRSTHFCHWLPRGANGGFWRTNCRPNLGVRTASSALLLAFLEHDDHGVTRQAGSLSRRLSDRRRAGHNLPSLLQHFDNMVFHRLPTARLSKIVGVQHFLIRESFDFHGTSLRVENCSRYQWICPLERHRRAGPRNSFLLHRPRCDARGHRRLGQTRIARENYGYHGEARCGQESGRTSAYKERRSLCRGPGA